MSVKRELKELQIHSAERETNVGRNVPNLRFPGFDGEWDKCELGDIADITKGAGISKEQRSSEGTPCILYGELYTTYSTEIIDEVVSRTQLPADGLVKSKANDVIIPASGETAIDISTARCVTKSNVFLGGDLNIIRLKGQDGRFFSYQLNGVRKKDIAKIAQGVSIVHLHGGDLKQIKVNYPSQLEQEKISALLSHIDQRISIQNKVIERYESLIRAIYHEALSTATGTTINLGDLVQIKKGTQLNSENLLTRGRYYVMNGGITPSGFYDSYNTPGEVISISEGGNSCGYVQYNASPFWSGGHCYTLLPKSLYKNVVNHRYLYHHLKYHQNDIMAMRIGSGLPNIQKKDLERFQIILPEPQEQERYTTLFDAVESILALEKDLLNKYLEKKTYLISKMFI